jgi:hypothetical protein
MLIPDPNFSIPEVSASWIRIHIKELFLTQKIVFKLSEVCSGMLIPDPDLDFLPIPNPGSRGQKGTGSRIRIRNTEKYHFLKTSNGFNTSSPLELNDYR